MASKINWHRYGTKLRHCHPIKQCCDPSIRPTVCLSHAPSLKTEHFTALIYGMLIGSRTHWPAWPYGPGNIVSPLSGRYLILFIAIYSYLQLVVIILYSDIDGASQISCGERDGAGQRPDSRRISNNILRTTSGRLRSTWSILHTARVYRITCSLRLCWRQVRQLAFFHVLFEKPKATVRPVSGLCYNAKLYSVMQFVSCYLLQAAWSKEVIISV